MPSAGLTVGLLPEPVEGLCTVPVVGRTCVPVEGLCTVPVEGRTCVPVEGRTCVPVEGLTVTPVEGRTAVDGLLEGLCTVVLGLLDPEEPVAAGLDTEVDGFTDVPDEGRVADGRDTDDDDDERDTDDDERDGAELDDLVACLFDEEDD